MTDFKWVSLDLRHADHQNMNKPKGFEQDPDKETV